MSYGTFKSYYDKNEQTTRKTNRLREKRTYYDKNRKACQNRCKTNT